MTPEGSRSGFYDAATGEGHQIVVSQGSIEEDAPLPQEQQQQQKLRQDTGFSGRTDETYTTGDTILTTSPQRCRSPTRYEPVAQLRLGQYSVNNQPSLQRSSSNGQIRRTLSSVQIFESLISISGTIGLGLFTDSGEILRIAGPAGALLAFGLVGLGVIFVMAGVTEMIGHWPIPGALFEFVKTFVDKELGVVLGIAYWLAYAITFGTLISALLDLSNYWEWSYTLKLFSLSFCVPTIAVVINMQQVEFFGLIESGLGALKLILVVGSFIAMLAINTGAGEAPAIGLKYVNKGFQSDERVTTSPFVALLVAIPIATYGFAGVEIVAVAALEARPKQSLKTPSRYIAVVISALYVLSVLGFCLNVNWDDPHLPSMSTRATGGTTTGASILIIAATQSGIPHLAGVLNGCLMLTVFSAANTALYVASRTIFGVCRHVRSESWGGSIRAIGKTHPSNGVPKRAVLLSLVPGAWLPLVHINTQDQSFQEIMSGAATVSIILVWAAQCLAFYRYRRWEDFRFQYYSLVWLSKHPHMLVGLFTKYSVEHQENPDLLTHIQPIPAFFGGIGCLVTVIGFSTASWWWGHFSATSVLAAFLMPGLLLLLWTILKVYSTRSMFRTSVELSNDWNDLQNAIDDLDYMIQQKPVKDRNEAPEAPEASPEAS